MSDLRELYQEVILDHSRNPRHRGKIENASTDAEGFNPLCGDKLHLYLKLENDIVTDIKFEGSGCAISTASASLMTDAVIGKSKNDAMALFQKFHTMLTDKNAPLPDNLDKLSILAGVKDFPMRVKCATLAWHTLNAALQHQQQPVSTE